MVGGGPGLEAARLDLTCHLKLGQTFLVTAVKLGFCVLFNGLDYSEEVAALFPDCRLTAVQRYEPECRRVPDSSGGAPSQQEQQPPTLPLSSGS